MVRKSGSRALKATPSNAGDMDPHTITLQGALKTLCEQLVSAKPPQSLQQYAHGYQIKHMAPGVAAQCVSGLVADADTSWSTDLEPGHFTTSVVQWNFDAKTMWRGAPSNSEVYRIAKSIIAVGLRSDCNGNSRSHPIGWSPTHIYIYVYAYAHVHIYIYIFMCMCISTHIHMHLYPYTPIHVYS